MEATGFGGTTVSTMAVGAVRLSVTRYTSRIALDHHVHNRPYFCVVRQGGFLEVSGRRRIDHSTGDMIFHPSGEEHANEFSGSGAECFNVEIPEMLVRELPVDARTFRQATLRRLFARLHDELASSDRSSLVVEGLVYQALGEAFQRDRTVVPESALENARRLLSAGLEERWTIAEVARNVGMSPVSLARGFRRRFGMTIAAYIRAVRIEAACQQLRDHSLTLAEIALSTGFSDQSHFSRVFHRQTGVSPGRYRRQALGR